MDRTEHQDGSPTHQLPLDRELPASLGLESLTACFWGLCVESRGSGVIEKGLFHPRSAILRILKLDFSLKVH